MNFNLKGKFLAGNIYHQFESICRDVDEFVSKDSMKFVENQVQSVGMTVKRLYSNVVQDVREQVFMQDHVSVTSINTNSTSTCIDEKQMFINQGFMHTSRDSDASLPIEVDHLLQFSKPPFEDPSSEAETCLHLKEYGDAVIWNCEESKEDNRRDSISVTDNSSLANEFFSDEDHKNYATIKMETRAFNYEKGNKSLSDGSECLPDISSTGRLLESKLTKVGDPYSDENGSLSSPSVTTAQKVNEDISLLMDSSLLSACDANDSALVKDRAECDSNSTKDESFHVPTSVQSFECVFPCFSCNEKEEMDVTPSTCCTSPKCSSLMESTSTDFVKNAEKIFHYHREFDGCAFYLSTLSSITAADETKDVDTLPAALILESNDNNVIQTDRSESVTGSSENESRHEQHYKDGHSKIVLSPSDSANIYEVNELAGNLDMETVDLSPDVKENGRSVVLNSNYVHSASHRRRNFRYYKKLIQDAFTSRKRLTKEYEHLAIMYGEFDMESNQHFKPSSAPSFPNTAGHAVKTESSQEMCETEWELL